MNITKEIAKLKTEREFIENVKPVVAELLDCIKAEAISRSEKGL